MIVNPLTGKVYVTNLESNNQQRFEGANIFAGAVTNPADSVRGGVLVKRGNLTRPPFGVLQLFGTSRVPGPLPIAVTPHCPQAQSLALGMCQS